ncbi:glycosyltransferase family 2 protein [Photobacterium damselae subsp. damselae]|uniref:glycosyltransferase family 2 protein n=1 Tax=Photobacterium damselae TaxID=38293 RepID=UPI00083B983A|nr:glycosyltransferase [Photobacterium damselae]QSH58004.1 glycosyltransferase family 2 protein [Photobacterium damselae subsp. damselae]
MKYPLVSYIILSYNHEEYIREAISSAINQDYSNIEYIILDDYSTDSTFDIIIEEITKCDKNIFHKKHKKNLGLIKNLEYGLSKANGSIIVLAAGDDIACSYRVSETVNQIVNHKYSFVSFNDYSIDSSGKLGHQLFKMKRKQEIVNLDNFCFQFKDIFSGASRGFDRNVFDTFGSINIDCPTEDTPYLLRCLMYGDGIVLNIPGIYYRTHDNNLSSAESLNKMDLKAIENQYIKDMKTARDKMLINNSDILKIRMWIKYITSIKQASRSNKIKKIFIYSVTFFSCKLFRTKLIHKLLKEFK